MNDDNQQLNFELEKMIRKASKIGYEKRKTSEAREKRKLCIKEKKYLPKQNVEKDYE